MQLRLADADIRRHPPDRELNSRPVGRWRSNDGCTFVIFKSGERKHRCQFSYKPYKQTGTGMVEYDDLAECALPVPQVQTDHVAEQRGDLPGKGG